MRDYGVAKVVWGERVAFELSPAARIVVGQGALFTEGYLWASETHVARLSEFDPESPPPPT